VVAFYVVILGLSPTTTGLILVICSILVFVPVKYVYPSRTKVFRSLNLLTTAIWMASYAVLLAQMPNPNAIVVAISLAYLVYYGGLSLYLTFWVPRRKVG
jgi:phosphatidylcholine synthase